MAEGGSSTPTPSVQLSERQLACLELIAEGKTSRAIAKALGLSPRTVDHYSKFICAKLGVRTRAQAVSVAVALGIIKPPSWWPSQ